MATVWTRPLSTSTPVRFHAEVPLAALLRLMHLGVAFALAFFVELDAAVIVASTMLPRLSSRPLRVKSALTCLRMSSAKSYSSSIWRKFRIVVSSGDQLAQLQAREVAQRGDLIQCFFHRRIAQRKPVLH